MLTPIPRVILPLNLTNNTKVDSYGIETAATWRVRDNWRLLAAYSFLYLDAHGGGSSVADQGSVTDIETATPKNQFHLRSYYELTRNIELNAGLYYVDSVLQYDTPSYIRVDAGVTWRANANMSLRAWVQNVFDNRHREFGSIPYNPASEIERAAFVQLELRY
jgi:iron complex outermembrane receptor protein